MKLYTLYIIIFMLQRHDEIVGIAGRDLQFFGKTFFTYHPAVITAYFEFVGKALEQ